MGSVGSITSNGNESVRNRKEQLDRLIKGLADSKSIDNIQSTDINPDPYVVRNSDIGIGGDVSGWRKYLQSEGFTDAIIDDIRRLTNMHGGAESQQAVADREIVEALESGSDLGRALEATIAYEEASYKAWIDKHKNDPEPWMSRIYDGEKRIFRKGARKEGVEAWTVSEDGANMGSGGIGYDHDTTVEQMLRDGYHILGGIARHLGSPGESEVTFVKYKKKK